MLRAAVVACVPWLALLVAAICCLWLVLRLARCRFDLRRLVLLHRDQVGSVQSLSFVATLPIFVMLMMLIVQISQVMVATIVVQYAAFASARSAVVWIPAAIGQGNMIDENQEENEISVADVGSRGGFLIRRINSGNRGDKFKQIEYSAALACMSIAPSRSPGGDVPASDLAQSVTRVYEAVSPGASANPRVPIRLANKLAYSLKNTAITIEVATPRLEWEYDEDTGIPLILLNDEIGWRDQVSVTVTHQYALLPGPGRLLARSVRSGGADPVSGRISQQNQFYVIPLTATATLPNEGEKSVWVQPREPLPELN